MITGAFPTACGKTNLAMLIPTLQGWKVETIGDDIAWMKFGDDGKLYAINPEAGFFGVAPGTGEKTNPNAMATVEGNSVFTNCAKTDDGDVWWEGMTDEPPAHAIDWHGNDWTPDSETPSAHPNARFTTPAVAGSGDRARVGGPQGRRGGRDALRRSPRDGRAAGDGGARLGARRVLGATMSSETTAAAPAARQAALRPVRDAAVLRLQHGRLLRHWLEIGKPEGAQLPKLFYVNWFRKDADGKSLAGLRRELARAEVGLPPLRRQAAAVEGPLGLVPTSTMSTTGLDMSDEEITYLTSINALKEQLPQMREFLAKFGDDLPDEIAARLDALEGRLAKV